MVRVIGFFLCTYACGSSRAVMAVGNVECVDILGEDLGDTGVHSIVVDYPECVDKLILVRELVFRLSGGCLCNDGIEFIVVLESEEYGLYVGILDAHVNHAVILLVLAGELVLLDNAVCVVVRMGAEDNSVLGAFAHGLGVHIILFLVFTYKPAALLPELEVLYGLVIGALFVFTCDGSEVNFRFGNVQEAFFSCHFAGFLRIEHIVRGCRNLGNKVLGGPYGRKGFYSYHITCSPGIYGYLLRRNRQSGGRLQDRRSHWPLKSGPPSSWELRIRVHRISPGEVHNCPASHRQRI